MTHTYQIEGMSCGSCVAKVKSALLMTPDVLSAEVSKEANTATIETDKHIPIRVLQERLTTKDPKYKISTTGHDEVAIQTSTWLETYKPILLIFSYITAVTLLIQFSSGSFDWMEWMRHFMAGFFLTFSFFKLLNLTDFANSYAMYDVVAKRFPAWGYWYAFIELALGIAFLIPLNLIATNAVAFTVMTVSIIGVLQSVLNKRQIQCACLGAVFNLPMSTVTIIEDALMIVMSGGMLIYLLN